MGTRSAWHVLRVLPSSRLPRRVGNIGDSPDERGSFIPSAQDRYARPRWASRSANNTNCIVSVYSSVPDLSGLFWENLYNDSAQMVLDSFSQLGNTNSGSSVRAWKSGRTGPDARRGEGVDVFSFHTSTLPYIHTRTRPQADGRSTSCFRIRDKSEQWHSSVPGWRNW